MSGPTEAVRRAAARASASSVSEDTLAAVRRKLADLRDLERERSDLEARLSENARTLERLRHQELVDLFSDARVDKLGLPAEGNLPAYDARLTPYYHANIAADWDDGRKAAAFAWLEDNGHGDLIKRVVSVEFGRGEAEDRRASELTAMLDAAGVSYKVERGVPWNTLTAFVREQDEKGEALPLDVLGAKVGRVVKLKERKDV